jgi:hypothetical protein
MELDDRGVPPRSVRCADITVVLRTGVLTRRRFVTLVGCGAAVAALPSCGDDAPPPPRGRFLDERQFAIVDAVTEVVLPGARAAAAVRYIDGLLAAFEVFPPAIFAGGPASGRAPLPDAHGRPSSEVPPDAFATFLPLSRVRGIAWRTRVYGSAGTPGGGFNDGVLGATRGWRDLYTSAIDALDAAAAQIVRGARFVELGASDQLTALSDADGAVPGFSDTLTGHVIEGMFAAPEYGGNAGLSGWAIARYDGDSAPLGHAFYDPTLGAYVDRPDQPTSSASPGDGPETFSPDVIQMLTIAALGSGGMVFS